MLITRIKPGERVLPHVDRGWAPEFYTAKFYVVLPGDAETVNLAGEGDDEERVVMAPGSIWAFENRVTHSIENNGTSERISRIVTGLSDFLCIGSYDAAEGAVACRDANNPTSRMSCWTSCWPGLIPGPPWPMAAF